MNANMPEQQPDPAIFEAAWQAIVARLGEGLTVAGICGSQASGKSTLSAALVRRAMLHQRGAPQAMSDAAIARFIPHYERTTRHILTEMPARADMVAWLADDRSARKIEVR